MYFKNNLLLTFIFDDKINLVILAPMQYKLDHHTLKTFNLNVYFIKLY
jgi:hypothetical protein